VATIGERKDDHLVLCASGEVGFRNASTLLECVRLVHDALPDMSMSDIDMSVTLLGKKLRAPLVIASMTGGTEEAGRINRELASIAEERGYGFGLGSQRAMVVRPGSTSTYRVRELAPTTLVLGNVGVVQARSMTTSELRVLVEEVGADAICVHLNPAMELVQPGGDRDFSQGLGTIARLVRDLGVPVVVKETGCGIAPSVGRRLRDVGVRHVDVSGAGGTSWVGVETKRAEAAGDERARGLGEALWDWGVPTAAAVALLGPMGFDTIVATGGVATGLDVARAIALGANAVGIARPLLRALSAGGRQGAMALMDGIEGELGAAMLLTGSRDLAALRRAPRVVVGELGSWMAQLGREDHRQKVIRSRP
jgi:isopentenyl-diphosphate delta-isomerase